MGIRRAKALPHLLSLATTALLFLGLWLLTDMHFALGDDFYIARAFAGEVGGVAESYNAHLHTVFAWLLHGLTLLFPGVWWFSWLQVGLLFFASYCIVLGLCRAAQRLDKPLWLGWLLALLFLFAFTLEFSTSITFTTTAAVLGAAGVCLAGGVDLTKRSSGLALVGSMVPGLLAYFLREASGLPSLAFWFGMVLIRLLDGAFHREQSPLALKRALSGLAAALVILAAAVGIRLADNALTPEQDYREFIDATTVPIDYGGLSAASEETLAEVGWTEQEVALIRSWYFMDENMSAANFRKIEADAQNAPKPSFGEQLRQTVARIQLLFTKTTNTRDFFLICWGLCGAAFLAACFRRCLWDFLPPIGCAAVTTLLLFYLGWQGRLPMRAAAAVLLPGCAMALLLAVSAGARIAPLKLWARAPVYGALALGLAIALHGGATAFSFYYNPDHGDPNECVYQRVEEYVLARQDCLFVGDRTLGVDRRLFPNREEGIPTNLLPMWGGWNNHSEGYRAAFASHGLQHDRFVITDFLGEQMRLVTGEEGISPEFLAYLEEQAGGGVTPIAEVQGDGFAVYRFEKD
ncbi:MAG: hypothetical protein PHI98_01185 [Eubacteriales bacterium]|nr:hypothetical protein [Eubacteriales bacterium]